MRLFYTFIVLVVVSSSSFGQRLSSFPYLSSKELGFIVRLEGDTVKGEIKLKSLPNYVEIKIESGDWDNLYAGKIRKVDKQGHIFIPVEYGKALSVGGSKRSIMEVIDTGYI